MTTNNRLDDYLQAFSVRLKHLVVARGLAVLCLALVLISAIGAWLGVRTGFADSVVFSARFGLLLASTAIVVGLIILPRRRIDRNTAGEIEARTPAFSGRVETYLGVKDPTNPLRGLLAEDAAAVAARFPIEQQIKPQSFRLPAAVTAASLGVLLWLGVAGPGLLNYGVRHVWLGWMGLDVLPPQSIAVTPGDEAVRRGGTLTVRARMEGFEPGSASLYARMGPGDWQEVDMARSGENFEFSFFSVREPFSYYIAAAGIRSPAYQVDVVDLPDVEGFRLTYEYPEWTRRPDETIDPGGDIRVITGTQVNLELVTANASGRRRAGTQRSGRRPGRRRHGCSEPLRGDPGWRVLCRGAGRWGADPLNR